MPPLRSLASLWLRGVVSVRVMSQDCAVMVGALCFVLRGSNKSAGSSDGGGAATVVQIVSTRAKDSSSLDAPRFKAATAASASALTGDRTMSQPLAAAASPQSAESRVLRDQRRQPDESPV